MQTPTAVEGTDRTMAWETENVRPKVRRIAEDAARRAGVRLEQWLDEALLEWAAGGRPEEGHGESRSDHSGLRRDPVSLRDNGSFLLQTEEARARQNENSLESAIARIERRMALGEDRTARAFETIAHMLDRPRGSRVTLFTETGRSTVEDAVSRVATQPFEAHVANAVPGSEEKSVSPRNLDERMEDIARRIEELEAIA